MSNNKVEATFHGLHFLTEEEHEIVEIAGSLMGKFSAIVGPGKSRNADLREACTLIHGLQNMVLAQAAARAYPDIYRLMGDEK